jgi:putative membrane protein
MMMLGLSLAFLVALIHVYIFVLESFLWTKPRGLKVFRMDAAKAEATRVLAFNQGFYNLFLAAGLGWGLSSGAELFPRTAFFLIVVAAAGIVGGLSVARNILLVQTVPALLALVALTVADHLSR